VSCVIKWPLRAKKKGKKKSLTYKALCVNHVLLGSELLKFMAKCNSAIGSFFFFEASVGSFLSHRDFLDLLDSDLHRTYIRTYWEVWICM